MASFGNQRLIIVRIHSIGRIQHTLFWPSSTSTRGSEFYPKRILWKNTRKPFTKQLLFVPFITLTYLVVVWELSGLMMNSDLQTLYTETSGRIQKWIKNVHLFFLIVLPVVYTVPLMITNFCAYCITDLGNEAFDKLSNIMW